MTLHVAFAVGLEDLLEAPAALRAKGVTPLSFFGDETDEPSVIARPDAGIVSWSEWSGS
jgi:lactoylglutathione lyase